MVFFGWEAPSISKHVDFQAFAFASSTRLKTWKQFLGRTSINVTWTYHALATTEALREERSNARRSEAKRDENAQFRGKMKLKSFKDSPEHWLLEDGLVCFWNGFPEGVTVSYFFSRSVVASDTTMPH